MRRTREETKRLFEEAKRLVKEEGLSYNKARIRVGLGAGTFQYYKKKELGEEQKRTKKPFLSTLEIPKAVDTDKILVLVCTTKNIKEIISNL